ncbi:UPF0389 protein CG9231-like [Ptychodera flava]|uniref:UPF0389 protein CG9231-like n=1 Tax=Ptychodera flava TaxID=63121 RepID=UPI00396A3475
MISRTNIFRLIAGVQGVNIHNSSKTAFATVFRRCRPCSTSSSTTTEKDITTTEKATQKQQSQAEVSGQSGRINVRGHRPSELDKTILVKTGRFKSKEDIPDFVSDDVINRAKSKTRIYLNILMAAILMVAIAFMIRKGRHDVDEGESLSLVNMRRHPQVYQTAIEEEEKRHSK